MDITVCGWKQRWDEVWPMDIYRFFHPHHNPRLLNTPVREQELSELEQAASELLKALERARQRMERKPVPPLLPQHFMEVIKAVRFVSHSLQTLCEAHPGDTPEALLELAEERSEFSGWRSWTSLVREQWAHSRTSSGDGEPRPN